MFWKQYWYFTLYLLSIKIFQLLHTYLEEFYDKKMIIKLNYVFYKKKTKTISTNMALLQ